MMEAQVDLNAVYAPSDEDVVARELHGEFIIIPITSGVGDLEDAIYSLNETGRAIWDKLDGKKRLEEVVLELSSEFEAPPEEIRKDVAGLTEELIQRKMIIEIK